MTKDEGSVSPYFLENVKKAIEIIGGMEGTVEDDEIIDALMSNSIDPIDANKILVFLPIIFCRRILPNLHWPDEYVETNLFTKKIKTNKFSQTIPYTLIWQEVDRYLSNNPQRDIIFKIGGRSSEFHTINHLLNAGGKVEDIKLTPMVISWTL